MPDGSGGALCTNCGLCCAGALHDRATLGDDEVEWARSVGLPISKREGSAFTLPCPKLVDCKCSIFHQRPRVCPGYRCKLLQDVDKGAFSLTEALEKVATAQRYFAEANAALTVSTFAQARYRARHIPATELGADGERASPDQLKERLLVTRVDVFLDRHFRGPGDMPMYKAAEDLPSSEMNVEEAG